MLLGSDSTGQACGSIKSRRILASVVLAEPCSRRAQRRVRADRPQRGREPGDQQLKIVVAHVDIRLEQRNLPLSVRNRKW